MKSAIRSTIASMKLIVGLGNPGKKFENTRHNVGFVVLDELKTKISNLQFPIYNQFLNSNFQFEKKFNAEVLKLDGLLLAKPQTYMNDSGVAVKKLVIRYKIKMSDLWIIHDDLDLRLGAYKIQKGVGPKLHYGIQSIEKELNNKDFWRVRVGVDNRTYINRIFGESYVLESFTNVEFRQLYKVFELVTDKSLRLLRTSKRL